MDAIKRSSLIGILDAHYIDWREDGEGNIMAADEYTQGGKPFVTWVNVSNWSMGKLKAWLGY